MGYLLSFYIFRGEWIGQDYIKQSKAKTCIMIQTNALMTFFLFKEFMSLFKRLNLNGISQFYQHFLVLDGHGSHVMLEAIG